MRSPVFRHAGSWRHAGRAWWYPTQIAPRRWCEAVVSTMVLCATCCVSRVWLIGSCGAMTACHHLRGGILGAPIGGPRMSPTPRSAKYGATHGCHPLRGLIIPRLSESAALAQVREERGTRRCGRSGEAVSTPERWSGAGSVWSGCLCTHTPLTSETVARGEVIRYPARGCSCA